MKVLAYTNVSSYKYRIDREIEVPLPLYVTRWFGNSSIVIGKVRLSPRGLLIEAGWYCDGPSGPTIDDSSNLWPAMKHDALYAALRSGFLNKKARKDIDKLFREDLLKLAPVEAVRKGRWARFMAKMKTAGRRIRAQYYYAAVRSPFGKAAAAAKQKADPQYIRYVVKFDGY